MPKPRYKTNNWKHYNKALINRGSLTFWIDEETISQVEAKQARQAWQTSPIQRLSHYYYCIDQGAGNGSISDITVNRN